MAKKNPSIEPPATKDDPHHARRLAKILREASKVSGEKNVKAEQSAKFIEAAKSLGCGENESDFDNTLRTLTSAPPPKTTEKRKSKKPAK
jgi:hypothetical protein